MDIEYLHFFLQKEHDWAFGRGIRNKGRKNKLKHKQNKVLPMGMGTLKI